MIHHSHPNNHTRRERKGFSAIDIALPTNVMNVAEITLTERHPETGFALNQESTMVARILEGSATFECEGEQVELSEGSTVLVETNKKYCWIPHGSVTLYIVSSPPWTPEQARDIQE